MDVHGNDFTAGSGVPFTEHILMAERGIIAGVTDIHVQPDPGSCRSSGTQCGNKIQTFRHGAAEFIPFIFPFTLHRVQIFDSDLDAVFP